MEKVESALDVLSRAATMVQPCPAYPASDSDSFGKYLYSSFLLVLEFRREILTFYFITSAPLKTRTKELYLIVI